MFEAAVLWAKEYGDVLGTVGFLFALTTIIYTNGRVIMLRLRNQPITSPGPQLLTDSSAMSKDTAPLVTEYGDKTPIAVSTPKSLGEVEPHFSEGLAEDIITDLQRLGFAVPDIHTVDNLMASGDSLQMVARRLQVPHVLTSSIRRQGDKVRVSAQLIAETGAVVWSERYDSEGNDLMAIQVQIANELTANLAEIIEPKDLIIDPNSGKPFATREQALKVVSSPKSRLTALMLCTPPIGFFGAHRFYVGRPWTGLLYMATAGLFLFGWLIDVILILSGMFADGSNKPIAIWRHDPLSNLSQSQTPSDAS